MSIEWKAAKDVELFRNGSVHGFSRLIGLITLEQVINSMVRLTGRVL